MTRLFFTLLFFVSFSAQAFDFGFSKRDYIFVTGSSTVSPLMAAVAEEFSRVKSLQNSPVKTPVVESIGTKNGFKAFCAGVGKNHPDFADASRHITDSEVENCERNGVKEIVEIKIGYDGIVLANFKGHKKIKLTEEQVFQALAEKTYDKKSGKLILNPYKRWKEIDAKLPDAEIMIYGPPAGSGTRDILIEMVMEGVCFNKKEFVENISDEFSRKKQCKSLRRDGRFIESGENDDVIVENIKSNPNSFGIFGFNFLIANQNVIQAVQINNVDPSFETISSKKYPLSRPLFVYFKKEHLDLAPHMRDFIMEIISSETLGRKGYLLHSGLVALNDSELAEIRKNVLSKIYE